MLDRIDSRSNGAFGSGCPMGVSGGLFPQGVRFVHQGVQLFLGHLGSVHLIRHGEHASRSASLNHIRSILHVQTNGIPDSFRAVRHTYVNARLFAKHAISETGIIAVSAGCPDRIHTS